jgi:mono/diheme cytochrome c family protein
MKKITVVVMLAVAALTLTYCSSTKKAAAPAPVSKVNYQANIMSIVQANCAPCHFPDKGGRKKPLDTYAAVSSQIDDILRRVQMEPGQRGFMPDRKPNKIAEADIKAFQQWKADGLVEKQ